MEQDSGRSPSGRAAGQGPQPPAASSQSSIPSAGCDLCRDEDGEVFLPMYGVAPHECYWRKGPEFTLGQSTLKPFTADDCFVPDLLEDEDWSAFRYPAACGVFYCPNCGREAYEREWTRLVERIGPPPEQIAQGIEAGTDETPKAIQPEGRKPGPEGAP